MKRILLILVLLAGCASGPAPIDDARKRFDEGRSDEALALLQKSLRENPEDLALKAEYCRMRDIAVTQWLAQADGLRQAARFDAAEALYRRVLGHDPANPRSISNNTIWDLVEDRHGNIWVGSEGGVDLWRRETEDFERVGRGGGPGERLSSPFVRRLVLDGERTLWEVLVEPRGRRCHRGDIRRGPHVDVEQFKLGEGEVGQVHLDALVPQGDRQWQAGVHVESASGAGD